MTVREMKHIFLFCVAFAAHVVLPALVWLLWRKGALLVMPLFILCHYLLNRLNLYCGRTRREIKALSIAHIVFTVGAHLLFQWLWSTYVYGGRPDAETIAAGQLVLLIGVGITSFLLMHNLNKDESRK